jgi:hypothetical protein
MKVMLFVFQLMENKGLAQWKRCASAVFWGGLPKKLNQSTKYL